MLGYCRCCSSASAFRDTGICLSMTKGKNSGEERRKKGVGGLYVLFKDKNASLFSRDLLNVKDLLIVCQKKNLLIVCKTLSTACCPFSLNWLCFMCDGLFGRFRFHTSSSRVYVGLFFT